MIRQVVTPWASSLPSRSAISRPSAVAIVPPRCTTFPSARTRPVSIVIGDASRDELDTDAPHIRALELFCVRAGMKVLSLSARGVSGIGDAVAIHQPNIVVLAGGHLADDTVARWAYAVRLAAGAMPVAVYRRGDQRVRMRTTGTSMLPSGASDAQRRLLELIDAEQDAARIAVASARAHRDASSGGGQRASM